MELPCGSRRVFHKSVKYAAYNLVLALLFTGPATVIPIVYGEKHLKGPTCDEPLGIFLLVGGAISGLAFLISLYTVYTTVTLRRIYRTMNTLHLGYSDAEGAKNAAAWLGTHKSIIVATNAARSFVRLCVLAWTVAGSVWVFRSNTCENLAPELYWVAFSMVIYWYALLVTWGVSELLIFNGVQSCFIDLPLGMLLEKLRNPPPPFAGYDKDDVKNPHAMETESPDANSSSWGSSYWDSETISTSEHGAEDDVMDAPHCFYEKSFPVVAFCNVCAKKISGKGLCCEVCMFAVHPACEKRAKANCKVCYAIKATRGGAAPPHHWMKGNCPGAVQTQCSVCFKTTASSKALENYRCVWCHATCHEGCRHAVSPVCTYGMHRPLLCPPSWVIKKHNISLPKHECRFKFVPNPVATVPLLVFINCKSGGLQGEFLLRKFKRLLNPLQVFDLANGGPVPGIRAFKHIPNFRILGCGGDGTIGWILSKLDEMQDEADDTDMIVTNPPPVGVLPLGTGNDLARCLEWGPGYEGENMTLVLNRVLTAAVTDMDRWSIHSWPAGTTPGSSDDDGELLAVMNNYMSLGTDARMTLAFHEQREAHPEKFNSRLRNKLHYTTIGANGVFCGPSVPLKDQIELVCDGEVIDLNGIQGIMILNLYSYSAGCNPWGPNPSAPWKKASYNDKLLEVLTVSSGLHVARMQSNQRAVGGAYRVAQCSELTIRFIGELEELEVQVDGEPWRQQAATIRISHLKQSKMMVPTAPLI